MAHRIRVPKSGQLHDSAHAFPAMPRRCKAFRRFPCPFRSRHWSLTGTLGHGRLFSMCGPHFHFYDFITRHWFDRDSPNPEIRTAAVSNAPELTGFLHKAKDIIYLTKAFADKDTEYQLFGLAHETVHMILRRDFGIATSLGLDILYRRSLRCLGGHNMKTYEIAVLGAQSSTRIAEG